MKFASAKAPGIKEQRGSRLGEQLRRELMDIVLRGQLRDPRAQHVVVTHVRVSPDLQRANVYVRTDGSCTAPEPVVGAMQHAAKYLRHLLCERLQEQRFIPTLSFVWDTSIDNGQHMEALFQDLSQ